MEPGKAFVLLAFSAGALRRTSESSEMSDPEQPSDLQTMQDSPATPEDCAKGSRVITEVVCPYCADLCDDLHLTVERNHVAAVEVECPAGRAFFRPMDYTPSHAEDFSQSYRLVVGIYTGAIGERVSKKLDNLRRW